MDKAKFPNQFSKINFKHESAKGFMSVIIPVYKDAEGLNDTLKSLMHQSLEKKRYEIIIANDGADEKVSGICKKYAVKEIRLSPNQGSYAARDAALEESEGEFYAFVDADIKVPTNWLKNGLKSLKSADYAGGPVIIDKKQIKTLADYYEFKTGFDIDRYMNHFSFAPTANLFTKRKVIEKIGGFDRRFQSSGDAEFGDRVRNYSHFKQLCIKEIAVIHPPRGYKKLIKKQKRLAKGFADFSKFYPKRFKRLYRKRLLLSFKKIFNSKKTIGKLKDRAKKFNIIQIMLFALWIKLILYFYAGIYKIKSLW